MALTNKNADSLLWHFVIVACFITHFARWLIENMHVTGHLIVKKGMLVNYGVPELFVAICSIYAAISAYYTVRRCCIEAKDGYQTLAVGLCNAMLVTLALAGPLFDYDKYMHVQLCILFTLAIYVTAVNIFVRTEYRRRNKRSREDHE